MTVWNSAATTVRLSLENAGVKQLERRIPSDQIQAFQLGLSRQHSIEGVAATGFRQLSGGGSADLRGRLAV